jgi:hypothetical protein
MWSKHNGGNQKWRIQYLSRRRATKVVGRRVGGNKKNGFWVSRPFQILTTMRSRRLLTASGNNVVIANKNN